jgi:hypothetical protein
MANIEINALPLATTVSAVNDFLPLEHSNGDGTYTTKKATPSQVAGLSPTQTVTALEVILQANAGYNLNTGLAGYMIAPYGGTINSVTMVANITGSIVVDVWRCNSSIFDASVTHPVAADSICASAKPTITAGVYYKDAILTGWTKDFTGGDIFAFNVSSTSGSISKVTLSLNVTKTSIP